MKKILNNQKGFTLIELIVATAIITILASISIPTFVNVLKDAHKADAITIARNAYTLARVDLLNDEIDGETAVITDNDRNEICGACGANTCDITYTATPTPDLKVTTSNKYFTATVENGVMNGPTEITH